METQNISELEKEVLEDANEHLDQIKAFRERRGSYPTRPKNDAQQIAHNIYLSRMPPLCPDYGKDAVYSITDQDILESYRKKK